MEKRTGRILVVDDEVHIRKNLGLLFKVEGYQVDSAENGEDALVQCGERDKRYDIVFMDLQMPRMGGLELLTHLRRLYPETAVVVISAFGTVARAVEAVKLGAVDFLEKPFDPEKVKILAEEILFRKSVQANASVDDLLRLAALARQRNALSESRAYLKTALLRDFARPEPFYWLGFLEEAEGRSRSAMQMYYMALDAVPTYAPAREALKKLGYIGNPEKKETV